jgi:hypothetical protein
MYSGKISVPPGGGGIDELSVGLCNPKYNLAVQKPDKIFNNKSTNLLG